MGRRIRDVVRNCMRCRSRMGELDHFECPLCRRALCVDCMIHLSALAAWICRRCDQGPISRPTSKPFRPLDGSPLFPSDPS